MARPASDAAARPRRLARAGSFARIAIGVALLALLYRWRAIDLAALRSVAARPDLLVLALLAALATIPLEAWRWHILLRAQGLSLRLGGTIRAFATSIFFGNFLPGAAGGDLIRGVYVFRAARGQRTPALLSIIIDRLVGLAAFVLLGAVAVIARPGARDGILDASIVTLSVLFAATLLALYLVGPGLGRLSRRLLAGRSARLVQIIDDTGAALRQYVRDWPSLALALLLSIVIVGLAVTPIVLIAVATGFPGLSLLDYGIAGLYALIANSLPLTPGGIGVGETAFASACLMLEPQAPQAPFGTVFLAFRCLFVLSTIPGWVVDLALRQIDRRSARPP
jgi:glycosyltransferase 2 family protein